MEDRFDRLDRLEREYAQIGELQGRIEVVEGVRRSVPISIVIFAVLASLMFPGMLMPPRIGSGYFLQWALVPTGLVVAAIAAEVWARIRLPQLQEKLVRLQMECDEKKFLG